MRFWPQRGRSSAGVSVTKATAALALWVTLVAVTAAAPPTKSNNRKSHNRKSQHSNSNNKHRHSNKHNNKLDHSKEPWLADESFYDVYTEVNQPQADMGGGGGGEVGAPGGGDLCPPVPAVLPRGGCRRPECSSDQQCEDGYMCCYNGCVYTCRPKVEPPPHFDWYREPRRRSQSGKSWLIPGPDNRREESPCSTTPQDDDSDPLLCPHGYKCSITQEGNPLKGIPNSGVCIRKRRGGHKKSKTGWRHSGQHSQEVSADVLVVDSETHRACDLGQGQVLLQGHEHVVDGKTCICRDRKLICKG